MKKYLLSALLLIMSFSFEGMAQDFGIKAMYVDFRVEVRTPQALLTLADNAEKRGFNTILMEYEASFPFEKHATLKKKFAFTRDEINTFINYCSSKGIDVIPLQNCMGHCQYILRHDRYDTLREDPSDVSQVCPLQIDEAKKVFGEIFAEVAALHPSKYFHIGCDETMLLGKCPECHDFVEKYGKSKLFVEYVKAMCEIVHGLGKTPVIWADIILKYPEYISELPKDLVFLDWNYGWGVDSSCLAANLSKSGTIIWGAPALRCGPDNLFLTSWMMHFNNLKNFVPYARSAGYKGIVQTSWSTSGAYSYVYAQRDQIVHMIPRRIVYPESGFNILLDATSWAFSHKEPLDPESFIRNYAIDKLGLDEKGAGIIWNYLNMPQLNVSAVSGCDTKGTPISDLIEECQTQATLLRTLKAKRNKEEIVHFILMNDIRINYLKYRQCEFEFESPSYDECLRASLVSRMKQICKEGREIDRRMEKLQKGYLQAGEIEYLKLYRREDMERFYELLK